MRPLNFDEDFDDRGQLRDGHRMRVPMRMADSADRRSARLHDGRGNAVGNKPGFVVSDAVSRDAVERAYSEYDASVASAWRGDADNDYGITGFGDSELHGLEIGSACTVKEGGGRFGAEGSRGTLQLVEGELGCVADSNRSDDTNDEREAAYQEYENRIQNAWRDGR